MKQRYLILLFGLCFISCSDWKNDLVSCKSDIESYENADSLNKLAVDQYGQLYNMSFDLWSRKGNNDVCYGPDASGTQKNVWGSANASTSLFNKQTCTPDSVFVAVKGKGKNAVKLQTNLINAILTKKLASGCIFTGQMGNINISALSASLKWGIPFTLRPKALEGYACYKPVMIDVANAPYKDRKGTLDNGHVFVLLTDWDEQFTVDPGISSFVDVDNDPCIIGYGKVTFDRVMNDYEKFTLDIEYRNERTPRYVVIVASSSALGDFFTGGDGSTLYLDEFRFLYDQ